MSRSSTAPSVARPRGRTQSYLYLLPALVLVIGIVHYGIISNVVISTWQWNGVSPTHQEVGGANYARMFADPVFWQSLANTGVFAVVTVSVQLVLGFLLAVLVRTRSFGTGLLRTLLFVPVVLSGAIVATCFRFLLTPDGGFNQLLQSIGFADFDHPWLASPGTALLCIAAINIWQFTGYSFVMYDAALGQVDNSVIEASRMDGASTFRLMWSVLFPLTRGTHLILIVLGVIGALKAFELVFLTTGGGPGTSTEFLSTYIYRLGIPQFDASYSATLSVALVVLALVFAALQIRLSTKKG
ncbi:carbohydrate ABC transporter permease [Herbiconiux sp. A18JL235]|uniref:Carbohydrate ABC transporter permease n=1 Tax=Herbiconiux sp. A18JL235 TaxID=3152363 RepID=A0AB39BDL1_9MICO